MNLWSCGIIVTKRCRKKLSRLFPGKSTTVVPNSSYYYIIIIYSKVAFLEFWGCDFGSIFARKRSRLWNVSTTWPLLGESPEAPATHPTVAARSKLQAKPPLRMPDNDVEVEVEVWWLLRREAGTKHILKSRDLDTSYRPMVQVLSRKRIWSAKIEHIILNEV